MVRVLSLILALILGCAFIISFVLVYVFEVLRLKGSGQEWGQAFKLQEPPAPTPKQIRDRALKRFEAWHESLCRDPEMLHHQSEKQFAQYAWLAALGWGVEDED